MVLSSKQRDDLNRAIADYLHASGFEASLSEFLRESSTSSDFQSAAGLLEKKWTSVVRLQKKVTELEARIAEMEREYSVDGQASSLNNRPPSDTIPRPPAVHTMSGHRGAVTRVVCHPVFLGTCVSSSEDATIKVWDMETGRFERALTGHTDAVQDIAFNPAGPSSAGQTGAGRILASCSADLSIKVWEFETKFVCIKTLHGHDHNVSSVTFVSPEILVSSSRDKSLKIWNVTSGFCLYTLGQAHDEWIRMVRLAQLESSSRQPGQNGSIQTVANGDINSNTIGDTSNVAGRSSLLLATCSNDHSVKVWSLDPAVATTDSSRSTLASLTTTTMTTGVPANTVANPAKAAGPLTMVTDLRGHSHVVECIAWAPYTELTSLALSGNSSTSAETTDRQSWPGPFLASGSRDRLIIVWDVSTASGVTTLEGHDNWVRGLVFHPTSAKLLLSASDDRTVRVWDLRHQRCLKTLSGAHDHFVTALDFHGKAPFVISASVDQQIKVWECR